MSTQASRQTIESIAPRDVALHEVAPILMAGSVEQKNQHESVYRPPNEAESLPKEVWQQLELKGKGFVPFAPMSHLVRYSDDATQQSTQYLTPTTLASLERLNREIDWLDLLHADEKPEKVDLGDMSRADGRKFGKHEAHRNGTNVDMRPVAIDYDNRQVGHYATSPNYSREKTQVLVDLLHGDPNLDHVLFNDPEVNGVRPFSGHNDHLHVDFKK